MKDIGDAYFVLGIKLFEIGLIICCSYLREPILIGSLRGLICTIVLPKVFRKGERLSKDRCPKNDRERMGMKNVFYSSTVCSLMYAQVYTRPDIAFVVGVLGRFMSNASLIHYQAVKKVFRYLQGTKDHMLTY